MTINFYAFTENALLLGLSDGICFNNALAKREKQFIIYIYIMENHRTPVL